MAGDGTGTESVIRRKTRLRARQAAAGEPVASHALRRAIARAGQNEIGMAIAVGGITLRDEASLAELLELPEPQSLLCVLEGRGESLGLMAIAPDVMEGIVQQQTTGGLHPGSGPARRPTRTDAAMTAGLIDRMLAEFEAALGETPELTWAGGYRYASFLEESRTLGLLLEDVSYKVFSISVELGGGVKQGRMLFAVPGLAVRDSHRPGAQPGQRETGAGPRSPGHSATPAPEDWESAISEAVLASPATLHAVLARFNLPLASLMRWKTGDFVPLPLAHLSGVALEGPEGTSHARHLATGHLGQSKGFRAIRLSADDPAEMTPAIRSAARATRPALPAGQTAAAPPMDPTLAPAAGPMAPADDLSMDQPDMDLLPAAMFAGSQN